MYIKKECIDYIDCIGCSLINDDKCNSQEIVEIPYDFRNAKYRVIGIDTSAHTLLTNIDVDECNEIRHTRVSAYIDTTPKTKILDSSKEHGETNFQALKSDLRKGRDDTKLMHEIIYSIANAPKVKPKKQYRLKWNKLMIKIYKYLNSINSSYEWDYISYREIAEKVGIPSDTRLVNALNRLEHFGVIAILRVEPYTNKANGYKVLDTEVF